MQTCYNWRNLDHLLLEVLWGVVMAEWLNCTLSLSSMSLYNRIFAIGIYGIYLQGEIVEQFLPFNWRKRPPLQAHRYPPPKFWQLSWQPPLPMAHSLTSKFTRTPHLLHILLNIWTWKTYRNRWRQQRKRSSHCYSYKWKSRVCCYMNGNRCFHTHQYLEGNRINERKLLTIITIGKQCEY